ncbi:MAG: sigma-70 family RNA polymerase sigma factor [Clostridium sp.]|nr:sigma-70 family RNA polymerase sigma factor [Clostridium sp.]
MPEEEKNLIKKARTGDIKAFEELIKGCQSKVFNIAYRMVGNTDEAYEIAQEVFLKAYKSIKDFKGNSLFSTWLYRITTNTCLDELRKKKKVISLDEDIKFGDASIKHQIRDDSPGPEDLIEKAETVKLVNEMIELLPEDYKSVIVLRDIQGFSYKEISQIIKCPIGTVKSRINRARQMLKELFLKNGELIIKEFVK